MDTVDFLRESNAIEHVYDDKSLRKAVDAWDYIIEEPILTPKNILHTHRILMKGHLKGKDLGHFRERAVWVAGREGKPWYAVPELMENWTHQANKSKTEEKIKKDHISFEKIHGFVDGNGRVGRILMNYQRIKNNLPILIIYAGKEQLEYYKWFL